MQKIKISIIGLGYVGLPLAIAFSKKYKVVGFDVDKKRVLQLKKLNDSNNDTDLKKVNKKNITFTSRIYDVDKSDFFIITLPTPVKKNNTPDISMLINACKKINKFIKKNSIIVFESTVYPGLIEEKLVPILSENNNFKYNKDFYVGYSPERINPGDKLKKLENIVKITSGSNKKSSIMIDNLYSSIIKAGTYKVENIKIAEAAKVIENIQRDVNIALINNFYEIFSKLDIDFKKVMDASSTKWNFLNFKPGLVGGHCVGIDPYYLIDLCNRKKINMKVIKTSRNFNEKFHFYLKEKIFSKLKNKKIKNKKILIMGATFKENCKDVRNSGSIKLFNLLKKQNNNTHLYDPLVDKKKKYFIKTKFNELKKNYYDLIALIVPHKDFKKLGKNKIASLGKKDCIFFDLRNFMFS